ncbi:MAG: hypothetical protein OEL20_04430 [Sulfuritalea sp.]|nr:hypothetical protein [Sulfuritalea sp.]
MHKRHATRNVGRGRLILQRLLQQHNLTSQAKAVFDTLPEMRDVAAAYCWYVSPYVYDNKGLLLDRAVPEAIAALTKGGPNAARAGVRNFVNVLMQHSASICDLRISILTAEGDWAIWDYERPLMAVMSTHKRDAVMIRSRAKPFLPGAVAVKMLSYICTPADLQVAGIVIRTGDEVAL